jgi:hypothetical protein
MRRTVLSISAILMLTGGLAADAAAQTEEYSVEWMPEAGTTGSWIGALAGAATLATLLGLYASVERENDDPVLAQALLAGGLVGGAMGAFVGQVAGTAIGSRADLRPAVWVQGGWIQGTDLSDAGSTGGGLRLALGTRMTKRLTAVAEVARFASPVRTSAVSGRSWTGTITNVALVERVDVPLHDRVIGHALIGLGHGWKTGTIDAPPPIGPIPRTETSVYVTAGGGLGTWLTRRLRLMGEARWEPAWGPGTVSLTLGIAYR